MAVMKLLDPLQGYKIASGNIYMNKLHKLTSSKFKQLFVLLWWQLKGALFICKSALFAMMVVHASCFCLEEVKKDHHLIPQLLDVACIMMQTIIAISRMLGYFTKVRYSIPKQCMSIQTKKPIIRLF